MDTANVVEPEDFEFASAPNLRGPLPGPNARRLIERDHKFLSPSYTRDYPLVVKRGRGAVIEDVDGNLFLDFTAGIAVCSTGHCHPRVVRAIQNQAAQLIHMSGTDFYYAQQSELAEKLARMAPGSGAKRVFFTNSGAESIEAAFKLARHYTGRQNVISFLGAFHGRTMGALALTGSKAIQKRGFGPMVPGVTHVPYANQFADGRECVAFIEKMILNKIVPADSVAAIFVEPIQGEGGYIVPPPDFHPALKALCEEHGILYVADEVQTGMGRTGRMFAIERWGVEPDIICLAKGIASGMPLGAIIAKAEIMNWPPGAHASTYGGNPISCAAALETIRLLEEGLMANAERVGHRLMGELEEIRMRHPIISEVRGAGLMVGVDLMRVEGGMRRAAPEDRSEMVRRCFEKGLLVLGCGESAIRLCPPLMITDRDVDVAVGILDQALGEMEAGRQRMAS